MSTDKLQVKVAILLPPVGLATGGYISNTGDKLRNFLLARSKQGPNNRGPVVSKYTGPCQLGSNPSTQINSQKS